MGDLLHDYASAGVDLQRVAYGANGALKHILLNEIFSRNLFFILTKLVGE